MHDNHHYHFSCPDCVSEPSRNLTLKWMRTERWTLVWRRPRGRAWTLQSLHCLHLLNTQESLYLRTILSQSGRGRWTWRSQVWHRRKTTMRYYTNTMPQIRRVAYFYRLPMAYLISGGVYSPLIHLIWWWGRGPGHPRWQEVPWWSHHEQLQGQVSAQRKQKGDSYVSLLTYFQVYFLCHCIWYLLIYITEYEH